MGRRKLRGIVRRMDDTGRVVVPAEIRALGKFSKTPYVEIFGTDDGGIYMRPFFGQPPQEESQGG